MDLPLLGTCCVQGVPTVIFSMMLLSAWEKEACSSAWAPERDRSTRFAETLAREFTCSTDVLRCSFRLFIPQGFDRCVQLNDHAGKPLGERVVNVARHPRALFQNGGVPLLFGDLSRRALRASRGGLRPGLVRSPPDDMLAPRCWMPMKPRTSPKISIGTIRNFPHARPIR